MDDLIKYVTLASAVLSAAVSLVTLYQIRLYIGKELAKGVKKLDL